MIWGSQHCFQTAFKRVRASLNHRDVLSLGWWEKKPSLVSLARDASNILARKLKKVKGNPIFAFYLFTFAFLTRAVALNYASHRLK